MARRLRLLASTAALAVAVVMVWQTSTPPSSPARVELRSTFAPMSAASTTIKWPVIDITDPEPFNPCEDIPIDVVSGLGLAFTPPQRETELRCHYDAGNYQMAIEPIVWRTYAETLPPDAVQFDVQGHRAAEFWIMKPTDWNSRWWITCMIAFKTDYGVLQQSIFYSPIYSQPDVDCMAENRMRAEQLVPHYVF
ncbi:DUF3558 domain-containing protein [Mycobacterium sp. MYCO198283]|uniref:DUF3558 domain-containing protein n=1 Tax=Mycobacterium sp. MYCO198283 TaxID=2883505 RepID=UPI001E39CA7A|nr:DUF3558 domain-containing protein [Mycobacterium sp. MYCO198283]MCG5433809.1 DUF3558 domain-containing protein [Mycobacterium sp. MYCO198283]